MPDERTLTRTRHTTDTRTNPYLLQRVRADTAPGPDAFKSNEPQKLFILDNEDSVFVKKVVKSSNDELNKAIHELHLNVGSVWGQRQLYPMKYWMNVNPKRAVACDWRHNANSVYVCLQFSEREIFQCHVEGTPEKKCKWSFHTVNLTTKMVATDRWIQQEMSNDILWFSTPAPAWLK